MSIFSDLPDPVPYGFPASGSRLMPKSQSRAYLPSRVDLSVLFMFFPQVLLQTCFQNASKPCSAVLYLSLNGPLHSDTMMAWGQKDNTFRRTHRTPDLCSGHLK
ncbi:hypothetical protein AD949_12505 [Acetobacter orleanensis]|nr:hypothetical protein AD949_12505 [Acetobacter orleanensis]PCD80409.1 hypothetical protein CO710_01215 [Acetobacter orleanensis]